MRQLLKVCFFTVLVVGVMFAGSRAFAQVQLHELQIVINAFKAEYGPELAKSKASLLINNPPTANDPDFWWKLDNVQASYSSRFEQDTRVHYVFLFGGYARMAGMTLDGVIATICHELGHGLAGTPFKDHEEKAVLISVEGQADYFAYHSCLPRMFARIPPQKTLQTLPAEQVGLCKRVYDGDGKGLEFCKRAFAELEVEKKFFKENSDTDVDFNSADHSVVDKVESREAFYPPPQCRLDTMIAGILKKPRPACWFR